MFNLIAIPLGWVMWAIYQVVHNYGLSILLFTIFIKLLTLPSTYKMQVNQARISLLAPQLQKLKKSYANNQQRFQEEQNKLYAAEGVNPSGGCLGSFLTMFILLGVYRVVMQPLKFILRIDSGTITKATDALKKWLEANEMSEKYLSSRPELILLKYRNQPEIFSGVEGFYDKIKDFNVKIFGFDLTGVPSLHPEGGWTTMWVLLLMLPILAAIVQLVSSFITQAHSKKTNPDNPASNGCMTAMLYLSPIMTIWIGLGVPAGLSWYWLVNGVLSLIVTVLLYRYLSGERLTKINEKEKQKQLAKGPTWMQRMMEQSAQYQAEQQGRSGEANRTRYADGDDGMTRKERAEYEKKLIEAARKRAALKYGEDVPDTNNSDEDA